MSWRYPVKKINIVTCKEFYAGGVAVDVEYVDTASLVDRPQLTAVCLHGAPGEWYVRETQFANGFCVR